MKLRALQSVSILVLSLAFLPLPAPAAAATQQGGSMPRIGFMAAATPVATWRQARNLQAFLNGLHELGYEEGRNITIEYRSAEGNWDRLPAIAAELVELKVDVLVSAVCGAPLKAARAATSAIPIVVAACTEDMVESGIVASLARPGGNVTGLAKLTPELAAKRLEALMEMLPRASRIAVLWDPGYSAYASDWRELNATAHAKGVTLQPVEARSLVELETAFAAMVRLQADGVITFSDTMTYNAPDRVAGLALRHKLPLISPFREIAEAGGLISYGPNIPDMFRRTAGYVDKILKGAKPGDLAVGQPTMFELVINIKTARALDLAVPAAFLVRADEVIE